MRWTVIILVLALAGLVVVTGAETVNTPVYEESFSTDPGFQTNNPKTNYWDQEAGSFHYYLRDSSHAHVYKTVPLKAGSFRLEFDAHQTRSDLDSNFRFGLGDIDMYPDEGTTVYLEMDNGDLGPVFWFRTIDQNDHRIEVNSRMDSYGGSRSIYFTENVTYRAVIDYNRDFGSMSVKIEYAENGSYVWGTTLPKVGIYTNMDRIYFTTLNDVESANSVAEGWVDNIKLSSYVIAPDTTVRDPREPTLVTLEQTPLATYTQLEIGAPAAEHTTTPKSGSSPLSILVGVVAAALPCAVASRRRWR